MFDSPEYDKNGKINQSAYTNDEYDFFKTMYGDKDKHITPLSHYSCKNRSSQKSSTTTPIPVWLWIVLLICCFTPIFSSIANCDGEYMSGCIILTIIFLVSWIVAFLYRLK